MTVTWMPPAGVSTLMTIVVIALGAGAMMIFCLTLALGRHRKKE